MRRMLAFVLWVCTIVVPLCAFRYAQRPSVVFSGVQQALQSGEIDPRTVTSLLVYVSASLWTLVLVHVVFNVVSSIRRGEAMHTPRYTGVLASALLLLLAQRSSTVASTDNVEPGIPITATMSPVVAGGLLADVLSRRRRQRLSLQLGIEPDVVPDSHYRSLVDLADSRTRVDRESTGTERIENREAQSLISVVERTRPIDVVPVSDAMIEAHRVVVRTFGYPIVENLTGVNAVFRKTRSLELLTWLVFNRQRMRRSAARTAMWEGSISDSSFATVVSDARRGLSELCPGTDPREWITPTFSDEMPLSELVVSDCDVLRSAMVKFRNDPQSFCGLVVHHLDGVRDLPFAGTNYRWPDLDGTTTRVVMQVLTAVNEVVEFCLDSGDRQSAVQALSAGLRMMPGHDVLLRLQKKLCVVEPTRVATFLSEEHLHRMLL